ncbi:MAG: terminase family protein [Desulfovibrionaceae bacterium]
MRITHKYQPNAHQARIHANLKRFSVLVAHRRFGKTVLCVNALIAAALRCKRSRPRLAYMAPLYKQARVVAWDYFRHYCRDVPGVQFNKTELSVDFPGPEGPGSGPRIALLGADDPDRLRGIYLDGVVLDEMAQMPSTLWGEVVRPALADRKGWAVFIGTPQGKNAFYELWRRAVDDPAWYAAMFRASETGLIDPGELDAARREMTEEQYEQEFECSFHASIRGAYYGRAIARAEKDGRVAEVPHEPMLPVHTAWDLGMSDATAIWFVQQADSGQVRIIDYYENSGEPLAHYIRVLKEKDYAYGRHIAPHDIRVRELGTGVSRLEVAQKLGVRFDVAPPLPVADGVNAVRSLLPKCWFDARRCKEGIEALRHYRREFNDRAGDFKDRPLHDWTSHAADALRYYAVGFRPEKTGPRQQRTVTDYNPFRRPQNGSRP